MAIRDPLPSYTGIATFLRAPLVDAEEVQPGTVAIIGAPHDCATRQGSRAGPKAIREGSLHLAYYFETAANHELLDISSGKTVRWDGNGSLVDTGDVNTVLATPFVLLTVSASLQIFDRTLELASMSLGGTPLYTFTRVTLPMIRPGILSGAVFAFVTSFDELILALFVSGTTSVILPRRMWDGVRVELDPTIAAVAAILITASALSFGLFRLLQPRRLPGRALRAVGNAAAPGGEGLLPSETSP